MTGHTITTDIADNYLELVELAKANISGSLRRRFIEKAQHRLVDRLLQRGLIAPEDVIDLAM